MPEAIVLIYSNKREDIYCVFTWTIAVITGLMTVSQSLKFPWRLVLNKKYKDATHIACAVYAKCDYLLTTDIRLIKRYKGEEIKILNPVDFIQLETEEDS